MDYFKSIEPVTVLKTKSAELIRQARESGRPIIITQNGKATAVLQDVESFQRQREALLLLKFLAKGEQELREGKAVNHAEATRRLQRKLKDLQGG
ncbi:type II toxin-antitoxin system Phd/YefM family antitoxin [Acidobacteria bacterium AH-259-G07]|nr:type II toxin-antitoxin system Phd/YefM family antitoxin [Acidobacteria bacterium AH-259-G07]